MNKQLLLIVTCLTVVVNACFAVPTPVRTKAKKISPEMMQKKMRTIIFTNNSGNDIRLMLTFADKKTSTFDIKKDGKLIKKITTPGITNYKLSIKKRWRIPRKIVPWLTKNQSRQDKFCRATYQERSQ